MTKFKTRKITAPNGYEYEVQVVDDTRHASVDDTSTPQRVGTETRRERGTEDKRERRTEDKGPETANPDDKPAARRAARRPGAAARRAE